jgi:TonB-linked SusC/RagA family outer membrane protein
MKKKDFLLLGFITLFCQTLVAQNIVKGVVTDANNEALPSATIQIKGTNTGTITNFNGEYTLSINNDDAVIVFSYLGMITQEIRYVGQTTLNVQLQDQKNKLNEVVVIGYGAVKRKDVTGSVSSVKDSIIGVNKTPNLSDALQGRIAGVNVVSQSGELGGAVNYNIRGSNSVFGDNSPLFVIDGVQIDIDQNEVASAGVGSVAPLDPLQNINPQDIESIEVLKDASATAIYGSRGANGVIIITTKKGEKGELQFEYTGSIGFSEPANRIDVISADEYLIYREARDPGNGFTNLDDGTPRDFSNIASNNWQDQILRTGIVSNHNFSASGATEKTNYSASVGFLQQEGVIEANDYSRYNARINVTHNQSDRLKLGFNLNTAFSETDGVANSGGGGGEFNGVVQLMVIANPWEMQDIIQEGIATEEYVSPLSLIEEAEKQIRFSRTIGSFYGEYKIMDHLTFRSQIGANFNGTKLKEFHNSESLFGARWNGRGVIRQSESYSYNWTNTLRYAKTFKGGHWVNVLLGHEAFKYNWETTFLDVTDFDFQGAGINDISLGQVFNNYGSQRNQNTRLSYFSRLNYTYKGKYLFTFNFRSDSSSKFGPGNRWGYFPGGAFAWRASRENFLKEVNAIEDLKLRVSYGLTGNERIPPFLYQQRTSPAFYATNDNLELGLAPGSLGNPDLGWETTTQFDIGFDVSLFDGRVSATFDYYNKLTTDMLIDVPIPAQSGFNSQWQNIGSVQNRGLEFSISTVNVKTKNFTWSTDFNISTNRNEVKDLGDLEFIPTIVSGGWITNPGRVQVGEPIGVMYGLVFDGIHQEGNEEGATPGTMKYKDLNGDGTINDDDRTIIGDSNPLHVGGFSNSFQYKNFGLSFLFQWSYGNDVFNAATLRTNGFQPFMNVTTDYYNNAWTPENQSNVAPAFGNIELVPSSYFVEDASFLRLKNVNFTYDFPSELFKNSDIDGLRLFISGNNLLTWTNYSGFDPEVSSRNPLIRGFERFSYPRATTIFMGLNLKF